MSPHSALGRALLLVSLTTATSLLAQPRGGTPQALPAGHPALDGGTVAAGPLPAQPADEEEGDDEGEALPPGHPSTGGNAAADNPHGGAMPGAFEPPPDTTEEDASLPSGTIVIELRDADNRALPGKGITLGVIHQSVAKGESREHKAAVSDGGGFARFDHLEGGSGVAYRVTVPEDGATFAAMPFQLSATRGMHVVLHVYPVVHDLGRAVVVMQAVVFAELKDDRVQLEQAITIYNFGKTAWVPDDVVMKLPENFTALNGNQQMGDQGVDAIDKKGAKLRGTFPPGRRDIDFRWQLPYAGEKEVVFDVGLPPHVAVMRVMALASQEMRLSAEGFPSAEKRTDGRGQHVLVTEKQLRREDAPLSTLHISLQDLPVPGPGRIIATCLAALGVALGLLLAVAGGAAPRPGKGRRASLLAELEDLERARVAKEIGPRTYERARRELIDAIARTLTAKSPA